MCGLLDLQSVPCGTTLEDTGTTRCGIGILKDFLVRDGLFSPHYSHTRSPLLALHSYDH